MKDTNNLLDYNVWSGTDYNNNTNGFINQQLKLTSSNKFCVIGEQSLEICKDGNNNWCSIDITSVIATGNTYRFSCEVYSPNSNGVITLRESGGNVVSISYVKSDIIQTVSGVIPITITPSSTKKAYFQLLNNTSNPAYFDNFSLVGQ